MRQQNLWEPAIRPSLYPFISAFSLQHKCRAQYTIGNMRIGKRVYYRKVHIESPISIYAERLCMRDILSAPVLEIATHTTSSDYIDM